MSVKGSIKLVRYVLAVAILAASCFAQVAITTLALPDGSVGASYAAVINTKLGSLPFTWTSGGLPAGLSLVQSNGRTATVSGTPTTAASWTFWVEVEGAGKHKSLVTYSIVISAAATLWQAHLSWQAGSPAAVSYAIYRGTVSGGPYAQIVSGLTSPVYTDSIPAGTYYYVATEFDATGLESHYSDEAKAVAPPVGGLFRIFRRKHR